jgi:hypothetical protein
MKLQLQPTMKTIILCASIAGLLTTAANAANVTWQAPGTISGAADVSTAGTLYGSWAPGDVHNPDVLPVNGVNFLAFGTPGVNFDINGANLNLDHYDGFANPNTANANYNFIMQNSLFNWNNTPMTLTWNSMTAGDTYLVQMWLNDGRGGQSGSSTFTGGANTSASVVIGNGAPGQYIIGTFVADGSGSQDVLISPGIMLNLVQVRDLTTVPEPSALALLATGAGAIFIGFRRKNLAI